MPGTGRDGGEDGEEPEVLDPECFTGGLFAGRQSDQHYNPVFIVRFYPGKKLIRFLEKVVQSGFFAQKIGSPRKEMEVGLWAFRVTDGGKAVDRRSISGVLKMVPQEGGSTVGEFAGLPDEDPSEDASADDRVHPDPAWKPHLSGELLVRAPDLEAWVGWNPVRFIGKAGENRRPA